MKCYLDITLLPSADIPFYFLWEKVYQQLHLALVEVQKSDNIVKIGAAFPTYKREKFPLGSKVRLFAPSITDLENLEINKWLSRLSDYVHMTSIRDVPKKIDGYAHYYRVNQRMSNEDKARNNAERLNIPYEQALVSLKGRCAEQPKEPFIYINSLSSEQRFRLPIGLQKADKSIFIKGFSTYGLSNKGTVPIF
ncbi:MAG TPA: type I-F CRISPR-associated endoribonuclease Cas6/Csy4 [Leucothrix sp.]|nr:type I-F CRISPR-associated endoribonuclease Cas6/Csy4 [Leucothrix sp.]